MRHGCNHPQQKQCSFAHPVPAIDRWFIHDRFRLTPIMRAFTLGKV
jgi:hypothetical protein